MFNWEHFLVDQGIPFVERGPNINRRQLAIKCVWCGQADPSEHLVLPRSGQWFSCRRNRTHGAATPHRLIMELLGCSYAVAETFVGDVGPSRNSDATFADQIRSLVDGPKSATEVRPQPLNFPAEFKALRDIGMGRRFYDYLFGRYYSGEQIDRLVDTYRLRYATKGRYANRLIIPVYTEDGLMSWTGRAIGNDSVRYKSHSGNDYWPNDPPSFWNIHDLLLNEHDLSSKVGDVLVVAEGPFDGMRLDFLGYPQVRGTCFFGKSVSNTQANKLNSIGRLYKRKWVLLDEDAKMDALRVQSQLQPGGFQIRYMSGGKDAAALPESDVNALLDSL